MLSDSLCPTLALCVVGGGDDNGGDDGGDDGGGDDECLLWTCSAL